MIQSALMFGLQQSTIIIKDVPPNDTWPPKNPEAIIGTVEIITNPIAPIKIILPKIELK